MRAISSACRPSLSTANHLTTSGTVGRRDLKGLRRYRHLDILSAGDNAPPRRETGVPAPISNPSVLDREAQAPSHARIPRAGPPWLPVAAQLFSEPVATQTSTLSASAVMRIHAAPGRTFGVLCHSPMIAALALPGSKRHPTRRRQASIGSRAQASHDIHRNDALASSFPGSLIARTVDGQSPGGGPQRYSRAKHGSHSRYA